MADTFKTIREVTAEPLEWTQRNVLGREYELRAQGQLVAALRWGKAFGSLAVAESAEGAWTFKRSGFLSPRVTVRVAGSESDVAVIKPSWRGEGTLECASGSRYRWVTAGFWHSEWSFVSDAGAPLVHFKPKFAVIKQVAEMKAEPGARSIPELSLLALLGWYLMVLMAEDSGGTAAAAAAAAAAA